MKRLDSIDLARGCGAALALACLCAPSAQAQEPAAGLKKVALTPTAPPTSGPGSLSGVWNNAGFKDYRTGPPTRPPPSLKGADGQPLPLAPWALAIAQKRVQDEIDGHPYAHGTTQCQPPGMPGSTGTPEALPLQILETPDKVVFLLEFFSNFRVVRMNAEHLKNPVPSLDGDSVGHWEGDTLVIDTIGISDKTDIRSVIPHTDALHVVERIKRTGPDTMESRVTLEDPKAFTGPITSVSRFRKVPGMRLEEYVCTNNRNGPDANGNATAQLK